MNKDSLPVEQAVSLARAELAGRIAQPNPLKATA